MHIKRFLNVYALLMQEIKNSNGLLNFLTQLAIQWPLAPQNTENVRITFSYFLPAYICRLVGYQCSTLEYVIPTLKEAFSQQFVKVIWLKFFNLEE